MARPAAKTGCRGAEGNDILEEHRRYIWDGVRSAATNAGTRSNRTRSQHTDMPAASRSTAIRFSDHCAFAKKGAARQVRDNAPMEET
jgi:hypothetical protein